MSTINLNIKILYQFNYQTRVPFGSPNQYRNEQNPAMKYHTMPIKTIPTSDLS